MPELLNKFHNGDGWRAPLFPIGTKGRPVIIGQDLELVYSALIQLLNTKKGTRVMYRSFGWDHGSIPWEPHDPFLQQELNSELRRCINTWEPRCVVDSIAYDPNPRLLNLGILIISITLTLVNNPRFSQTVFVPISSQGTLFKA